MSFASEKKFVLRTSISITLTMKLPSTLGYESRERRLLRRTELSRSALQGVFQLSLILSSSFYKKQNLDFWFQNFFDPGTFLSHGLLAKSYKMKTRKVSNSMLDFLFMSLWIVNQHFQSRKRRIGCGSRESCWTS